MEKTKTKNKSDNNNNDDAGTIQNDLQQTVPQRFQWKPLANAISASCCMRNIIRPTKHTHTTLYPNPATIGEGSMERIQHRITKDALMGSLIWPQHRHSANGPRLHAFLIKDDIIQHKINIFLSLSLSVYPRIAVFVFDLDGRGRGRERWMRHGAMRTEHTHTHTHRSCMQQIKRILIIKCLEKQFFSPHKMITISICFWNQLKKKKKRTVEKIKFDWLTK